MYTCWNNDEERKRENTRGQKVNVLKLYNTRKHMVHYDITIPLCAYH